MKRELANGCGAIDFGVSTRRVGLCWEATRAPRWTRIPQAWAAQAARAGFLRDRQECEKSQGVWGTASPKSPRLGLVQKQLPILRHTHPHPGPLPSDGRGRIVLHRSAYPTAWKLRETGLAVP